jgi:hypothetical protein
MSFRFLPLLSAAALAAAMSPALSQSAPPAASAPAAAPRASAPAPALRSPAEQRQEATIPGDLRPDEKVTPQIVIPLRKNAPQAKPERVDARRDSAASAPAVIDDAAARCEAQPSKAARARCHARIAPKPAPPPSR